MRSNENAHKPQPSSKNENESAIIKSYIESFRKTGVITLADWREPEQYMIVKWAKDVVERYGTYLEKNPMKIYSVENLPCPKENIKIAIKTLLPAYVNNASNEMRDLLEDRYVRLSEFQEIRPEDMETVQKQADAIEQKPQKTDISVFPTYHRYLQIALSEKKILIDEFDSLAKAFQTPKEDL